MGADATAISISVRHALVLAFAVGILAGGFSTLLAFQIGGATGFVAVDSTDPESQPSPSDTGNAPSAAGDSPSKDKVDPSKISLEGEPALGDKDAPVTMVEFADYQCPFCRKYASETFDQIKENYIDTGKVRFVYKDFPLEQLGHNRAKQMAEAAQCAGDQGKYWEMHDKLYEEQNKISPQRTAKFSADKVPQWAEEIGLNMDQFNQCMDSGKYSDEVDQDLQEGRDLGVSGTPTFFINGKKVVGAQPYSALQQVIEAELNS